MIDVVENLPVETDELVVNPIIADELEKHIPKSTELTALFGGLKITRDKLMPVKSGLAISRGKVIAFLVLGD